MVEGCTILTFGEDLIEMYMKYIGQALREMRIQRVLTLYDVGRIAKACGIGISTDWLANAEKTGAGLDSVKLELLAEIYSLTLGQLVNYLAIEGSWATPEDTTLILPVASAMSGPYRCGVIGKRDRTLSPAIPAGSLVRIDTRESVIEPERIKVMEWDRPIYFLRHEAAFYCGWCVLHENAVSLVPHPLSPIRARIWKRRDEVDVVGRVIAVIARGL
jgi:transcriptional regulator with XRE-family HTH domain